MHRKRCMPCEILFCIWSLLMKPYLQGELSHFSDLVSSDGAIPARRTLSSTTVNCEKPIRPRGIRVASSQSVGMPAHLFDAETVASAP